MLSTNLRSGMVFLMKLSTITRVIRYRHNYSVMSKTMWATIVLPSGDLVRWEYKKEGSRWYPLKTEKYHRLADRVILDDGTLLKSRFECIH